MKKVILALIAGVVMFGNISCSRENVDVKGSWKSEVTLKSELASPNEEDGVLGFSYVKQTIDFEFSEDGNYTRTVKQVLTKAEAISPAFDADEFMKAYGTAETNVVIHGTYTVRGDSLTLTNHSANYNGELLPYEEFYQQTQSLGPVVSTVKVRAEEDKISFDGLTFKKQ